MSAKYQVVRWKKGKLGPFEALTAPGSVLKYRAGKLGWDKVLSADVVFKNHKKGDKANDAELEKAFKTTDEMECLKTIVAEGELEVSSAERKEALDKKSKEVIAFLHRNYTDPKSNLPHPVVRLELALKNSKFRVDVDKPVDAQVAELVKALHGKLSFVKSEVEGTVLIPKQYVGSASGVVYKMTDVKREKYMPEGVKFEVGMAPGDFDPFINALNKVTQGDYQFNMAGQSNTATAQGTSEHDAAASGRAKKKNKKKGKKGKGGGGKK